jgi:hypothetical protein
MIKTKKKFWKELNLLLYLIFNKLNSLQIYEITQNEQNSTQRVLSVYHNITSKFHTIAIFKSFVKWSNDSNKAWKYAHEQNINFKFQVPFKFLFWFS